MGRKSTIPEIETRLGKPINQYFDDAIKERKSPQQIKDDVGLSLSATYDLINKLGLKEKLKKALKEIAFRAGDSELKLAIDEYLKAKQVAGRSKLTLTNVSMVLNGYLWWLNEKKIPAAMGAFSVSILRDFFLYLQTSTERWGGKSPISRRPVTAMTIYGYKKILIAFGNWLVLEEKIDKNPLYRIETPKVPKRLPEDIPNEGIKAILNSFDNSFEGIRNKSIVMMFLDTGMRLGDMEGLKHNQFDLNTGQGQVIGKGNKQRRVMLSPAMSTQLKTYIELRSGYAKCDDLWVRLDGKPLGRAGIKFMVHELNGIVPGIRIHPHIFRHVFARFLAEKDVPMLAMMHMGGWETYEMVMRYASAYSVEKSFKFHTLASPITNILG